MMGSKAARPTKAKQSFDDKQDSFALGAGQDEFGEWADIIGRTDGTTLPPPLIYNQRNAGRPNRGL